MAKRLPELDILRAIAVLGVIFAHWQWPMRVDVLPIWQRLPIKIMSVGGFGVDLFFVLSGFLVSGLLFREYVRHGSINVVHFLIRRGLKIYPAFYFFLAITIIAACGGLPLPDGLTFRRSLAEALFIANYLPGLWPHTWSLGVEEHFYLLVGISTYLAAVLRRGKSNPFRGLPVVALSVMCICLAVRMVYALNTDMDRAAVLRFTHTHMDSLTFGVFLAFVYHFKTEQAMAFVRRFRTAILLISCAALVVNTLWDGRVADIAFGPTLLYVAFGGIMALMVFKTGGKGFLHPIFRPMTYIGEHSYSIYLWHLATLTWLPAHFYHGVVPYLGLAMYTTIAVSTGIVFAKLIELPVLRLRDRLFPSRSTSVATP